MVYLTLTPSYGRDYKSAKEVKAAWEEGKDFTIADMFHPDSGRQVNKADAPKGATLNIRYKGLAQIAVVKT